MPIIDLVNEGLTAQGIAPQTLAATTQGASVDFSDGIDSMHMVVDVGSITTANVTSLVVQCEEWSGLNATSAADNGVTGNGSSTWAAIPNMVVTVTATTASANTHQVVRGLRSQQYVRANANTLAATTTTGAFPTSVMLVSQRKFVPVNKSGTDRFPST